MSARERAPLPNRVTPTGELVASPARGLLMGNRGRLHDAERRLTGRRWTTRAWVCCRLSFRDRRREVMAPGRYTELFFLDEATALAAGHRPCGECRRGAYREFCRLWAAATGDRPVARDVDIRLHGERTPPGPARPLWRAPMGDLPRGTVVLVGAEPALVSGAGGLLRWTPFGYGPALRSVPDGEASVLTPRTIVAVLRAGYPVLLHPSADRPPVQVS